MERGERAAVAPREANRVPEIRIIDGQVERREAAADACQRGDEHRCCVSSLEAAAPGSRRSHGPSLDVPGESRSTAAFR